MRAAVAGAYARWSRLILRAVPDADVQHVGATAVLGSLTKGDLDINVRVDSTAFARADEALARLFDRNLGSTRTPTFSAFEAAGSSPAVGVQLSVIGSDDDIFVDQRGRLLADSALRAAYDALKRAFHGKPHEAYRDAKARFWAVTGNQRTTR